MGGPSAIITGISINIRRALVAAVAEVAASNLCKGQVLLRVSRASPPPPPHSLGLSLLRAQQQQQQQPRQWQQRLDPAQGQHHPYLCISGSRSFLTLSNPSFSRVLSAATDCPGEEPLPLPLPLPVMSTRDGLGEVLVSEHDREKTIAILVSPPAGKATLMKRKPDEPALKTLERLFKKLKAHEITLATKEGHVLLQFDRAQAKAMAQRLKAEAINKRASKGGGVTEGKSMPSSSEAAVIDDKTPVSQEPPSANENKELSNAAAFLEKSNVLRVDSVELPIRHHVPQVHSLRVRGFPLVGSPLFPVVMLEHTHKCDIKWYRTTRPLLKLPPIVTDVFGATSHCDVDPTVDVLVSSERVYTPSQDDLGHRLLCSCTPFCDFGGKGCTVTVVVGGEDRVNKHVECEATEARTVRELVLSSTAMERKEFAEKHVLFQGTFRLETYNILYDPFCDSDFALEHLYPYLSPLHAKQNLRLRKATEECASSRPDILCLQEVGYSDYYEAIEPRLELEGMFGVYANKITKVAWGLATFFRRERWSLLDTRRVDLTRSWEKHPKLKSFISSNPDLETVVRRTTSVAQMSVLRCADGNHNVLGKRLCVLNCHLFSHPLAPHIRLLQIAMLLEEVQHAYEHVPVLLCGDFNATDEEAAIRYIKAKKISRSDPVWAEGACLHAFRHETQQAREENWHSVLRQKDVDAIRTLFLKLASSSSSSPSASHGGLSSTARVGEEAGTDTVDENVSASRGTSQQVVVLTKDSLREGLPSDLMASLEGLLPNDQYTYEELFTEFALMKVGNRSTFDALGETIRSWGLPVPDVFELMASSEESKDGSSTGPFGEGSMALDLAHPFDFQLAVEAPSYSAGTSPRPAQVDFIFYTGPALEPCREQPPQHTTCEMEHGLPTETLPSDHVSMVADIGWRTYDE